jgi:long-chain acyl-CoA synthetase
MQIDLEFYRQPVRVSIQPALRLSVIDIAPDHAQRTMVFLHGFGGRATQWQYQLWKFSDENRVIASDLRGHGRSDKPAVGYNMPQLQEDLGAVLDRLGATAPIVLIGHSFGGAIAAEYASANPKRVSHLILIATAGEYQLNAMYRLLLRLPQSSLKALTLFTRRWLGAPPHVLKALYEDNLCCWNGWNLFRSLSVPTLVIRGHMDAVFERPYYEEVARAIPGAEEVDVGASGHMVMLERREAVDRAIQRFIDRSQPVLPHLPTTSPDRLRAQLIEERPWLRYYEEKVPYTIAVPRTPVHSFLDSAARRFRRKTALIFEGRRISYQRLGQDAARFANLLQRLGVMKGDRVMLLLPNSPQMVIAFYGTLKAGATAVFTLPTTESQELARQVRNSGASALIALTHSKDLIHEIKKQLEIEGASPLQHVIYTQFADYLPFVKRLALRLSYKDYERHRLGTPLDANTHFLYKALQEQSAEISEIEIAPSDLAVIQYTGGTTAQPKGVMLSHSNLVANALQTRHWIPEALEGQERFLCVLPFAHSYGLTAALNVPIALGATLILKARFEAADALRTIRKYRPTIFPGVPQMYVAIKDFPGVRKYGVSSIKACISGSAPLPVEVQEAFEKLTRGRLVEGYGLTEASPVTHANPLRGLRKVGSIGIPLPSTQARVVDLNKSDTPVPIGQIGELAVRGPQVMLGYWGDEAATRRVLSVDGWLLTGDVAQMDHDGYFRIIARKADLWYPSKPGNPAFPRDVEEVLFEVPQVKEAAVVAIAGQPIAFVIAGKDRPTAESLIAYCKRRLPPELTPRLVIFVDDFPRTFIGKVLRRELARLFQEHESENL